MRRKINYKKLYDYSGKYIFVGFDAREDPLSQSIFRGMNEGR